MARNKALSTGECRLPSMSHSVSDALHRKRRVDLRAQRYRQQENLHNILNASFQIGGTNAKLEFSLIFFFVSFSFDADSFRLRWENQIKRIMLTQIRSYTIQYTIIIIIGYSNGFVRYASGLAHTYRHPMIKYLQSAAVFLFKSRHANRNCIFLFVCVCMLAAGTCVCDWREKNDYLIEFSVVFSLFSLFDGVIDIVLAVPVWIWNLHFVCCHSHWIYKR